MASASRIKTDLNKELERELKAIVPRRPIDSRVKFKPFKNTENQDIRQYSADARSFQIMEPTNFQTSQIGGSTAHLNFQIEVVFAYPNQEDWSSAAADDLDYIRHWFLLHPSSVSGVCNRWVSRDRGITNIESGDDSRRYWSIFFDTEIEVTYGV
jgi:hypothetical protein